jgi:hypothetical protein
MFRPQTASVVPTVIITLFVGILSAYSFLLLSVLLSHTRCICLNNHSQLTITADADAASVWASIPTRLLLIAASLSPRVTRCRSLPFKLWVLARHGASRSFTGHHTS